MSSGQAKRVEDFWVRPAPITVRGLEVMLVPGVKDQQQLVAHNVMLSFMTKTWDESNRLNSERDKEAKKKRAEKAAERENKCRKRVGDVTNSRGRGLVLTFGGNDVCSALGEVEDGERKKREEKETAAREKEKKKMAILQEAHKKVTGGMKLVGDEKRALILAYRALRNRDAKAAELKAKGNTDTAFVALLAELGTTGFPWGELGIPDAADAGNEGPGRERAASGEEEGGGGEMMKRRRKRKRKKKKKKRRRSDE